MLLPVVEVAGGLGVRLGLAVAVATIATLLACAAAQTPGAQTE